MMLVLLLPLWVKFQLLLNGHVFSTLRSMWLIAHMLCKIQSNCCILHDVVLNTLPLLYGLPKLFCGGHKMQVWISSSIHVSCRHNLRCYARCDVYFAWYKFSNNVNYVAATVIRLMQLLQIKMLLLYLSSLWNLCYLWTDQLLFYKRHITQARQQLSTMMVKLVIIIILLCFLMLVKVSHNPCNL